MGVPRIWLLTASPRDPATGAIVTLRLAGGGTRGFNQFGSVDWKAGLVRPPLIAQRLGFDGGQFGDGSVIQALQMAWGGRDAVVKTLAALHWRDQSFTLHSGPEGGSDAEMILILSGRFADVTTAPGQLIMAMADPAVDLAKPLLSATFAGSGGIEGDAELKGDAKWRGWGALYNVTLRSLDKANNIHVATDPAFPIQAFDQIYDKGNAASALTLVNWAGSIAATLAALTATAAPSGGAAVAPSIACIKWWYPVPGKLTCDLRGEIGAGYVDRPADIAARMIGIAAGPAVDNASVVLARAARNHVAGWLISDASATTATELTALLSGVSLWWGLTAAGVIEFGMWAWDAPVATLKAERIDRVQSFKPVSKVSLGWKRNQSVMSRGDIAGVVLYGEVAGVPTTLAGVNAGEGAKLTGIEAGATVGANFNTNLANKPTTLAGVNAGEGAKLTGIAAGATVGADFNSNLANKPLTLAAINATEGGKLTGIETAATFGADIANNVKNGGVIIAREKLLNSQLVVNSDGTASYFDGSSTVNIGAVTFAGLPGKGALASLNSINPSTSQILARGSIMPFVPDGQFSYTSTTDSITITWPTIIAYRPDGTIVTISSGNQAVTGLFSGTGYKFYPYFVDGGGTTGVVSFAVGGTGAPAIAQPSSGSAANAATAFRLGNQSLGFFTAGTTSIGTGGGGGGGSSCLHPETLLNIRQKGLVRADRVRVGDQLPCPSGWADVTSVKRKPASLWIQVQTDGEWHATVTPDHRFYRASGGEARASALVLGDLMASAGDHREVTELRLVRDLRDVVEIELADPHLYYLGRGQLLCHNPKP